MQSRECGGRTIFSEIALLRVGYGYLKTCLGVFDGVGRSVDVRFEMRDSRVVVGDGSSGRNEGEG